MSWLSAYPGMPPLLTLFHTPIRPSIHAQLAAHPETASRSPTVAVWGARTDMGRGSLEAPAGSHFADVEFNYNRQGGSGHAAYITISDPSGSLLGLWNSGTGWQHANTDPMSSGHALTTWLDCSGGCPYSSSAHTYIKDLYFTIQDTTAPRITALSGTALSGDVLRGSETIAVTGFDGQGGLVGASVKVERSRGGPTRCAMSWLGWIGQRARALLPPLCHQLWMDAGDEYRKRSLGRMAKTSSRYASMI